MPTNKRKMRFAKNAAILTATSLILRAVGMFFRVYISSIVGAEGVGLYQLILSVYMLFAGFASSGIVVATTRMTTERLAVGDGAGARRVLRLCMGVSLAMGMISAIALVCLSGPISNGWISDPRALMSVRVMALALPFMSISCCLRGYFTARRRVGVSSASQMTEQLARIAVAMVLLHYMLPMGIAYACLAIMLADVISEGLGCLCISVGYLIDRRKLSSAKLRTDKEATAQERRVMWDITLPITASHYLTSLLRTVESILVPDCLAVFVLSRTRALELFGMVKGMALPLLLFPSTLLGALAMLLVPEISEAHALGKAGQVRHAISLTMKLTMTLSAVVGALFMLFPGELGMLVYNEPGLERILSVLSPLMPLMYAESVCVGILRGMGEQKASLLYGVSDSVIRIILIALLVPRMGLSGFLLVMVVSNVFTPVLHIRRMLRTAGMEYDWKEWGLLPLGCAGATLAGGYLVGLLPQMGSLGMLVRVIICAVIGVLCALPVGLYGSVGELDGIKRMWSARRAVSGARS